MTLDSMDEYRQCPKCGKTLINDTAETAPKFICVKCKEKYTELGLLIKILDDAGYCIVKKGAKR